MKKIGKLLTKVEQNIINGGKHLAQPEPRKPAADGMSLLINDK